MTKPRGFDGELTMQVAVFCLQPLSESKKFLFLVSKESWCFTYQTFVSKISVMKICVSWCLKRRFRGEAVKIVIRF